MTRCRNDLRPGAAFHGALYPGALEASGWASPRPDGRRRTDRLSEPARVAAVRATAAVRRYAAHNQLGILLTLTSEKPRPVDELLCLEARCRRQVQRRLKTTYPYVVVPEVGAGGRAHLHALVSPRSATELADLWSHGHTDVRSLETVGDVRRAATYLSKGFSTTPTTASRYSIARGFSPTRETIGAESRVGFIDQAVRRMNAEPEHIRTLEDFPAIRLEWGTTRPITSEN